MDFAIGNEDYSRAGWSVLSGQFSERKEDLSVVGARADGSKADLGAREIGFQTEEGAAVLHPMYLRGLEFEKASGLPTGSRQVPT
jgi:hypothetical protein